MITSTHQKDIRQLSQLELEELFKGIASPSFAQNRYTNGCGKRRPLLRRHDQPVKKLREFLDENFAINAMSSTRCITAKMEPSSRVSGYDEHLIESYSFPCLTITAILYVSSPGRLPHLYLLCYRTYERVRNLDAGEIYDQVVLVNRQAEETFGTIR